MKTRFTVSMLCVLLAGCMTNKSLPVSYYQLSTTQTLSEASALSQSSNIIIVDKVQLIELFNQQALVQLQPNNKVNIANFHFWAQPPSDMLTWHLINGLNTASDSTAIKSDKFYRHDEKHRRLVVEVDEFAGHFEKGAVMSGTWYLYTYKDKSYQLSQVHPFHFETELAQDGFNALVAAHQKNVKQLSLHINQSL
ncbi:MULTISPECIES: ABC-type transport auxiliary lipoprotein family protein [Pseudoalteromonas]|uniref:PqiC family protein n=1 Tax=Pseudoalteromonas TaxID=53246 RepID=UPI000FFE7836|nr:MULTISPECIES: ABC-type transport auxiliary lipoprotein family protein [Pseudoalteromonas]MDW7548517.1 ABC-type transport auxiliary lipoprotein family protein [Pseudoalteromonas peptidolytica]RXF04249.1 hypothetical protein D9603_06550 [Pseudoalteromonas sp. PS5]USD30736.1 membrane integrity-associated transporter subunit PqiC [Pseudoalteromonas sp. SCSIO 43201]